MGKKKGGHLVPVKKIVTRGGKTFETTVLVNPNKMEGVTHGGKVKVPTEKWAQITTLEDFEKARKLIFNKKDTGSKDALKNEFMAFMERSGVKWERCNTNAGIDWMRCMMKAKKMIANGEFVADGSGKVRDIPKFKEMGKEEARKQAQKISKMFKNYSDIEGLMKEEGVTWKHSDNKGINHLRMMVALREHLQDGKQFKYIEQEINPAYTKMKEAQKREKGTKKEKTYKIMSEFVSKSKNCMDIMKNIHSLPQEHKDLVNKLYQEAEGTTMQRLGEIHEKYFSQEIFDKNNKVETVKLSEKEKEDRLTRNKEREDDKTICSLSSSTKGLVKQLVELEKSRPDSDDYDDDDEYRKARKEFRSKRKEIKSKINEDIDRVIKESLAREPVFKSKDEVKEWANELGIKVTDEILDRIDLRAFNDIKPITEEMLEQYPQMKEYFWISYDFDKGALMSANGGLRFTSCFDDYENALYSSLYNLTSGHNVFGDGSIRTLIRHEFGHNVQDNILHGQKRFDDEWNEDGSLKVGGAEKRVKEENELYADCLGQDGISEYAFTNDGELFAEAFADATSTPFGEDGKQSDFAEGLRKHLKKYGVNIR